MIGKLLVLMLALVALLQTPVEAELYYNRLPNKPEQLQEYGLKCIPGRTVIKVEEPKVIDTPKSEEEGRRTHMNSEVKDELCKICVCSVEGKDEYCSRRPARNVNECVRLGILKKYLESNMPFSHERALSYRIRRDYIWHRDEIPYDAKASCRRGNSYYSNSVTANNTDIDVASDIDSLLDYSNKDICFYCVCSTDGTHAGCISRDPWFCEYYRIVRDPQAQIKNYRNLFKQDRPAYFRQLSYRLRRTMDDGMEALLDFVGDDQNSSCIPFVSEYSDCSEVNRCTGCNKCSCTADREWSCETVLECPTHEDAISEAGVSNALDVIYSKFDKNERKPTYLVPPPPKPEEEFLGSPSRYEEEFKDFKTLFSRYKRSVNSNTNEGIDDGNHTVQFYHTVDEINEDTLKGLNHSGTITAQKVAINHVPKISRRTNLYDSFNKSNFNALHIEYNQPQEYDPHISENKIEVHHHNKLGYNKEKLSKILGNYSSDNKDTILSKIVVNELKGGSERIGDREITPVSNITFTPENDTLTAMAFIAGNLLNKLWNMEKESTDFSIETEVLKHEKINDLLDLFKEPLSIRQENFIKNALEKLSDTLSKNKNVKNVSLCETIIDGDVSQEESFKSENISTKCIKDESTNKKYTEGELNVTTEAISKLNNVLDLIKKFDQVQDSLNDLRVKTLAKKTKLTEKIPTKANTPDNSSLKLFGNLLEKITKLLVPNKISKKVLGKIKRLDQLKDNNSIKSLVEDKYGININKKHITAKDKLILDYINHMENNPNCLLKKNLQNLKPQPSINVEGNILYNLSEFFKVKSFIDLVKLIKPNTLSKAETTVKSESLEVTTILAEPFGRIIKKDSLNEPKNLNATKKKLKNHLKALLEDMIELQNVHGIDREQTKLNIANALPCIYNILKADKMLNKDDNDKTNSQFEKIKNVFDYIKLELTSNNPQLPTRRSNLINNNNLTEKPQSLKIWERVIKNINAMQTKTRRSFHEIPVNSYQELKNIMDGVEASGNSYKNFAMLSVVPPEKQLMLLKTLEADTKQEENALEALKNSMQTIAELPMNKRSEIKEFIDNAENNINLSVKVLSNIEKSKKKIEENPFVEVFNIDRAKRPNNELETQNISEILAGYKNNNNIKLTRDQIVKQLIQKRIEYYLKSREETGLNISDDVNYTIGKRILFLMKSGNYNVAKELFKVFVANKRKEENDRQKKEATSYKGASMNEQRTKGRLLLALKEPLIRFEEPARDAQNQEHLFNQLLNFKNLS